MAGRPSWAILAEAGAAMLAASAAIRVVAFRRLSRRIGGRPLARVASASEAALIRRAVHAWSRRLPWRTMCFEEGLTAYWMLRRRGIQSTLHYGAAVIAGVLKAHVWVRSGDLDVVGCDNADDYALLASFPDSREGPPHVRSRSADVNFDGDIRGR